MLWRSSQRRVVGGHGALVVVGPWWSWGVGGGDGGREGAAVVEQSGGKRRNRGLAVRSSCTCNPSNRRCRKQKPASISRAHKPLKAQPLPSASAIAPFSFLRHSPDLLNNPASGGLARAPAGHHHVGVGSVLPRQRRDSGLCKCSPGSPDSYREWLRNVFLNGSS